MNSNILHWGFHIEVIARALKDLETATTADPKSAEFSFLRSEAKAIASEARDSLASIEVYLRAYDTSGDGPKSEPTQH